MKSPAKPGFVAGPAGWASKAASSCEGAGAGHDCGPPPLAGAGTRAAALRRAPFAARGRPQCAPSSANGTLALCGVSARVRCPQQTPFGMCRDVIGPPALTGRGSRCYPAGGWQKGPSFSLGLQTPDETQAGVSRQEIHRQRPTALAHASLGTHAGRGGAAGARGGPILHHNSRP
jgi:hypothetical protein